MSVKVALVVMSLPANAGDIRDAVQSLGWEDPLEKKMAPHSSILAWEIPWTEESGGLESMGSQKRRTRLRVWAQTWPEKQKLTF